MSPGASGARDPGSDDAGAVESLYRELLERWNERDAALRTTYTR